MKFQNQAVKSKVKLVLIPTFYNIPTKMLCGSNKAIDFKLLRLMIPDILPGVPNVKKKYLLNENSDSFLQLLYFLILARNYKNCILLLATCQR